MNQDNETDIMEEIDNNISPEESSLFRPRKMRGPSCVQNVEKAVIEQIASLLICQICFERLREPAYLSCGHRFCHDCIFSHLKEKMKKRCPACKKDNPLTACRKDIRVDYETSIIVKKINRVLPVQGGQQSSDDGFLSLKRVKANLNQPKDRQVSKKKFRCNNLSISEIEKDEKSQNTCLSASTSLKIIDLQSSFSRETDNSGIYDLMGKSSSSHPSFESSFRLSTSIDTTNNNNSISLDESTESSNKMGIKRTEASMEDHFLHKSYLQFQQKRKRIIQNNLNSTLENISIDVDCLDANQNSRQVKILFKRHPEDMLTPAIDFEMVFDENKQAKTIIYAVADRLNLGRKDIKVFSFNESTRKCSLIKKETRIGDLITFKRIKTLAGQEDLASIIDSFAKNWLDLSDQECAGRVYYRVIS